MKKNLLAIFLLFSLTIGMAQQMAYSTKIEEAVNTTGFLFKQEVFSLKNISLFRADALKITNIETFKSTSGLRIIQSIQVGKKQATLHSYIDAQEIDGLITALQYISTILKNPTMPSNYTEIKYNTLSGFQVKLYTMLNDQGKLAWRLTVCSKISEPASLREVPLNEISSLQDVFKQAKQKLQD